MKSSGSLLVSKGLVLGAPCWSWIGGKGCRRPPLMGPVRWWLVDKLPSVHASFLTYRQGAPFSFLAVFKSCISLLLYVQITVGHLWMPWFTCERILALLCGLHSIFGLHWPFWNLFSAEEPHQRLSFWLLSSLAWTPNTLFVQPIFLEKINFIEAQLFTILCKCLLHSNVIHFHYGFSQDTEYVFLCSTVEPGCSSILYVIVCICQPQTPNPALPLPLGNHKSAL